MMTLNVITRKSYFAMFLQPFYIKIVKEYLLGRIKEMGKKLYFYFALLSLVSINSLYSQENYNAPWKEFSKNYKNSDYNIRKDIAYFELRKYLFKREKQVSDRYIPYLSIYRKKLSDFPSKIVKSFQRTPFGKSKWTTITVKKLVSPEYSFRVKGFIITTDNKFWVINEKKDIAWLFDKIDTEAELYQYMEMYSYNGRKIENSYKKTAIGYDVKQVQIEYKIEKGVTRNGYNEYIDYQLYSTYIYHIKANGEFTKELVSTESKNKKIKKIATGTCAYPVFRDSRLPNEIFSEFKGVVTP